MCVFALGDISANLQGYFTTILYELAFFAFSIYEIPVQGNRFFTERGKDGKVLGTGQPIAALLTCVRREPHWGAAFPKGMNCKPHGLARVPWDRRSPLRLF